MKKPTVAFCFAAGLSVVLSVAALAGCSNSNEGSRPTEKLHLDLDMSAQEIQLNTEQHPEVLAQPAAQSAATELKQVTDAGVRLYAWLKVINDARPADQKLSFTSKATQKGHPIDTADPYNVALIKAKFADRLTASPQALRDVLMGTQALPTVIPTAEDVFLAWGREIIGSYDIAIRWISLIPDIDYYKVNAYRDVRGFYFLSRLADRDQKFADIATLPATEQLNIREWMVQMCMNNQSWNTVDRKGCDAEEQQAELTKTLPAMYAKNLPGSSQMWDDYFELDQLAVRKDIVWSKADPTVLRYPFLQPPEAPIQAYLKDNVEDEWHNADWHLAIDYKTVATPTLSHFDFIAGENAYADPEHNRIVMDANQPISEYDSQWTIRHEFGHLLGFVDCYVEFYDESAQAMVNYQLDITNLMCSRRGVFQPTHFEKLKAAYLK